MVSFVEADTPVEPQPAATVREITTTQTSDQSPPLWHPSVNLDHLEEEQQEVVKKMLHEESKAFARGEDDIGCIPNLQMVISLYSGLTPPSLNHFSEK